jgi:hypothetical protein
VVITNESLETSATGSKLTVMASGGEPADAAN